MTCAICGGGHGASESCSTLVRGGSLGSGTAVMGLNSDPVTPPVPAPVLNDSADPADPLIGVTFGSFRVIKLLGKGGMGTVYLGEQMVIGSKVAVKVLHDHLASNPGLVTRFYAEAKAVNMIGHENIVNIFDMNVAPPNRYYLIMEYLEGKSLASLTKGPVEAAIAVPILAQVCDALQSAHQHGVIHRDLKPENIFLTRRGKSDHFVKILDFGIAKLFASDSSEQTSAGMIVGTPEYMAPEQCSGEAVDGRADIYSLGVIAYLLATGRLPFTGGGLTGMLIAHREKVPARPRDVNPAVSQEWSDLIMKALSKKAGDRFPDADAFRVALEASLVTTQLAAAAEGAVKVPTPPPTPLPQLASTPQPVHSRHLASFKARLLNDAGEVIAHPDCVDLSRGGMFLCHQGPPPPIFSRARVILELPDQELPCLCEVVRHVTSDQAKAWGMSPGFGVQFIDGNAAFKENIARVVQGLPHTKPSAPAKSVDDDPTAEAQLQYYHKRINGDHYVVLALMQDVDFADLRVRGREARRELEALKARPLSARQQAQLETVLKRVAQAIEALSVPLKRVEYDANRANFRGVARAIAAGITVTELEKVRKDYLANHNKVEATAQIHYATGSSWENRGQFPIAMDEYEQALTLDPLNLTYQQRYWALKRKAQPGAARS